MPRVRIIKEVAPLRSLHLQYFFYLSLSELGVLVITILQGKDMAAMDSNGGFNAVSCLTLVLLNCKECLRGTPLIKHVKGAVFRLVTAHAYAHLRTAREAKHKCIFPRFVLMREKQLFNKDCWNVKKFGSNRVLSGNPRMIKLQIEKHVVTYFKACLFVCLLLLLLLLFSISAKRLVFTSG